MTKTKPQRTLKVLSALTDRLLVVRVTEGRKVDEYTVSSSDGAFWWSHTDNPNRRYRVDCGPSGPTECDCPARKPCRHLLGSITLIARGELALPEQDDRETVCDPHADAEEQDRHWDDWGNEVGPDRLADDAYADVLGRKLAREPLGA